MSDRIAACIVIGGTLPKAKVRRLLEAIEADHVCLEWGEARFHPASAKDLMAALEDGHLHLRDLEARYGELPELEAACRKLKLSFTRHSESKYEYDGQFVDWRPGMKAPLVRIASNDGGHAFVPENEVKQALALLEAGDVDRAVKLLRMLCPEVPPLPPFEII